MSTPAYTPFGQTPSAPGYGIPEQGYGSPQGYGPPQGVPQQPQQQPYAYGPPPVPAPARRRGRGKLIAAVVGAVVVVLVVLGAVFGSSGSNVESSLAKALKARPGITSVTDVSCPKSVDTDAGSTTTCQATVNGQRSDLTLSFDSDQHFVVTDAQPVG